MGWTLANALTGASFARKRYICSTNLLSVIPEVLKMRTETDLVNRTIRALTSLTDRRPNYFYLLRKYRIMDEIRAIAAANNLATQVCKCSLFSIKCQTARYREQTSWEAFICRIGFSCADPAVSPYKCWKEIWSFI